MRRVTQLVLFLVALAGAQAMPARAQTITDGQSLLDRCGVVQFVNPSAGLHCRGYIGAIADIMSTGDEIDSQRACPPNPLEREKLVKAVRSWLKANDAQDLAVEAYRLVARALSETYPCGG